jgi:hypothetical protein
MVETAPGLSLLSDSAPNLVVAWKECNQGVSPADDSQDSAHKESKP